ncbi:MAG: CpaF family protein [Chloroflexota bacterium]|nr:MAG: CpaF family protein [Chloroflexota bacterium]
MTDSHPIYMPLPLDPKLVKLKEYLANAVVRELEVHPVPLIEIPTATAKLLEQFYAQARLNLPDELRDRLLKEIHEQLAGYGPIQPLVEDPEISEIMVYGPRQVYIERGYELIDTGITFRDEEQLYRLIDRMVHPLGRQVDADHPTADARLPDGSRVNVVIPPVSIDGPCITIRKFLKNKLTIEELIALGALTDHMAEFLRACVIARLNILITGNTSSGKTTLLNVLSSFIPENERIITIEDAVELQLKQKYLVRLETKNPNIDGTGEVTTRELVRNALRMRPDRIVVGEVRGGESLDMLQAMNTGHSGSITTLHANAPRDAISRIETMAMMAGLELPLIAIRRQIASAINLIVHLQRLQDGTRRTVKITEVAGMEGDIVTLQDIFKFEQSGIDNTGKILGGLKATGIRPLFTPRLEVAGFKLRGEIFGAGGF